MNDKRRLILRTGFFLLLMAAAIPMVRQFVRPHKPALAESAIQTEDSPGDRLACHPLAPESLAIPVDGSVIYIAERTNRQILVLDPASHRVIATCTVPGDPTGLALSPDNRWLYGTCSGKENALLVIDCQNMQIVKKIKTAAGICSPVIGSDTASVYVLNRFANQLSVIDPVAGRVIHRIPAGREPIAAALTLDGSRLVVVNHLPEGSSDYHMTEVGTRQFHSQGTTVRLIDTASMEIADTIHLPAGSTNVRDVCISPDGRYAFVTHIFAHFQRPTDRLELGWINKNAFSVIDLHKQQATATVLLDSIKKGAANPWGIACSADGRFLLVAHSGTRELSVIDLPGLLARLEWLPEVERPRMVEYQSPYRGYGLFATTKSSVSRDLTFLTKFQRRIPLKGLGPRKIALWKNRAAISGYFSGSIEFVDLSEKEAGKTNPVLLGAADRPTEARRGEFLFHDASICYQNWQSCASCHPDGRSDALNWDLLNDGKGNPKNTKSLLLSHQTPPVMSLGIRADAETAVRSGLRYILFADRPEDEACAIDAYVKSLQAESVQSQENEALNPAVERGRTLFFSPETKCALCHKGPYYTDLRSYNVGTQDATAELAAFDTPSLIELWRTAPYFHDGRASTLEEMLTRFNPNDRHGKTSHLSQDQINDLVEFLNSL